MPRRPDTSGIKDSHWIMIQGKRVTSAELLRDATRGVEYFFSNQLRRSTKAAVACKQAIREGKKKAGRVKKKESEVTPAVVARKAPQRKSKIQKAHADNKPGRRTKNNDRSQRINGRANHSKQQEPVARLASRKGNKGNSTKTKPSRSRKVKIYHHGKKHT